jgi:hypothetical protein
MRNFRVDEMVTGRFASSPLVREARAVGISIDQDASSGAWRK